MTTVSIDQGLAQELIATNLAVIKTDIEEILTQWNESSAVKMIEKTRNGQLTEAEVDAIALTNLLEKQKELEALRIEIGGQ